MIANRLPLLMKQSGISIRRLARETGVTYTTIRAVYHGQRRSVQLEVIDAICQVLKVQPGDIYRHVPADEQAIEIAEQYPPPSEASASASRIPTRSTRPDSQNGWRNW